jgi:hypothetical protein
MPAFRPSFTHTTRPIAPDVDCERVTRGGDYVFDVAPERLTAFFRSGFSRAPQSGNRHIGFRCARSLPAG